MSVADSPFISIIIPTRNRRDLLKLNIESLLSQSHPKDRYEIIVVDNSSTDGTEEMIKSFQLDAPCSLAYYRKPDEGPGSSRNLGIAKAQGDILAFIDDDCVADSNWLENGARKMTEKVGLVQGKTLPNPNQRMRTFSRSQNIETENPHYQTCNILYRKDIVDLVGGFSSDFIGLDRFGVPLWGCEDTDLAWKVKKSGWKSVFAEEAIVYHHVFQVEPWNFIITYQKARHYFNLLPYLVKKHPELRNTDDFYQRFFLNRKTAMFDLFVLSMVLGLTLHQMFFLLGFPYAVDVLALSFYGRPLRTYYRGFIVLIIFLLKDFMEFMLLLAGSIRHRSLLL